jgi:hypothetical protein
MDRIDSLHQPKFFAAAAYCLSIDWMAPTSRGLKTGQPFLHDLALLIASDDPPGSGAGGRFAPSVLFYRTGHSELRIFHKLEVFIVFSDSCIEEK